MTAGELLAKLQALVDREDAAGLPVIVEGCDCYGHASDVIVWPINHATGERTPVIEIQRLETDGLGRTS